MISFSVNELYVGPPAQWGVCFYVSLYPSPCLCSLSQINKMLKKKKEHLKTIQFWTSYALYRVLTKGEEIQIWNGEGNGVILEVSACPKKFFFFFKDLFILEKVKEWVCKQGRGKGRGRESQVGSPLKHGDWGGAWSHAPGIMTWAKTKSQTLHWVSHPGTP